MPDEVIIWPAYIDKSKTRSEGRRIPLESAIKDPTTREIASAVKQIGYNPTIEQDKKYPRTWWEDKGRVKVQDVEDTKNDLLIAIAAYIDAIRE